MTTAATIFVVDDDDAVRKGLSLTLAERGYPVASFDSAERFLEALDTDRPGCLLLDIRMPDVSGLELQDILRSKGIKIPIIFITGHGDIPMTVRAMRHGAIDFLEKPYKLDVLLHRIEEALAEDRKNREQEFERQAITERHARLTGREREVMALVVAGAANTPNRVIADRLGISPRTVDTYRARLMEKMRARSLPDLVEMAKICGVYQPELP